MDGIQGLLVAGGIVVALIVAAFIWEMGRRAWFWSAAKIMGWTEQERFLRETQRIKNDVLREQRQHEKDVATDNFDRRRMGAYFVTLAIAMIAWRMNVQWWEIAIAATASYVGLHMVGGVALKWWG